MFFFFCNLPIFFPSKIKNIYIKKWFCLVSMSLRMRGFWLKSTKEESTRKARIRLIYICLEGKKAKEKNGIISFSIECIWPISWAQCNFHSQ